MISLPNPFKADLVAEICISTAAQLSSFSIIFLIYSRFEMAYYTGETVDLPPFFFGIMDMTNELNIGLF